MDEATQALLTELLNADVHCYDDEQDALRCIFCGYSHRFFDAEMAQLQRQHHVECLIVRTRLHLVRSKKDGPASSA